MFSVLPIKNYPSMSLKDTKTDFKYVYRYGKGFRVVVHDKLIGFYRTRKKAIEIATTFYGT